MFRLEFLALLLLTTLACGDKRSAPASSQENKGTTETTSPVAPPSPVAPALVMPDEPWTVARTQRQTRVRQSLDGKRQEWKLLNGIEVTDEELLPLYESRGTHFLGFRALLQGGKEDCLVEWRAELLGSSTGRGTTIDSIQGQVPVPANTTMTVSSIAPLAPMEASKVKSASSGYWSLCGKELEGAPTAFDLQVGEVGSEELALHDKGPHAPVHVSTFELRSTWKPGPTRERCYFELVHEDIDDRGFTLNRDFGSYSMGPGRELTAMVRRTTFEGGDHSDYASKIHESRNYLRKVECGGKLEIDPKHIDGVDIESVTLDPPIAEEEKKSDDLLRDRRRHRVTLTNTTDKDCSFHIRYQLLDEKGAPFTRTTPLGETLHIPKGKKVTYVSQAPRLGVWREQSDQVGELVIVRAAPISQCSKYDPSKAL